MIRMITGSSRHIVSPTIRTSGGSAAHRGKRGGWSPFAVAIACDVLLSAVVSFYFTPPMFALLYRRKKNTVVTAEHVQPGSHIAPLRRAAK
jgi:hypothetical protein